MLVESADEVIEPLAAVAAGLAASLRGRLADPAQAGPGDSAARQPALDPDHSRLWSALGFDPTPLDLLAHRTGLTVPQLSSMLLHMELDGRVVASDGRYARRPP